VTPSSSAAKITNVTRAGDPADVTIAAIANPVPANASIMPVVQLAPLPPDAVRVPDLTGMGARDAAKVILGAGLVPQIEGSGRVVKQNPVAGGAAAKGSAVRIVFEPAS
jgi:hypothetical protein